MKTMQAPHIRPRKPRVGLFMTAAGWFWEIAGDRPDSRYSSLAGTVEKAASEIETRLGGSMEVTSGGIVRNAQEARKAAARFKSADVDMVVLCCLIWSEDRQFHELLQLLKDVPLVIWCYQMQDRLPDSMNMMDLFRLSGPVGTLQMSGVMKRAGRDAGFVFGPVSDGKCMRELGEYAEAARMAKDLRGAVIGILPRHYSGMMSTWVDEFRLASEAGPVLRHISISEFRQRVDCVPEEKVNEFAADLRKRFEVLPEVSEDNLRHSCKISLGLARVIEDFNLDGIAVQDLEPELHSVLGTRPCICVPEIYARGCMVTMEAEVGTCVAMILQRQFSGRSPMYVEIFSYDVERNMVLAGHPAMHDVDALSRGDDSVVLTTDYEYDQVNKVKGVWQMFTARPGPVTLLSVVDSKDCFQMTIAAGESLEMGRILFGSPSMNVRLNAALPEFFEKAVRAGITQHWAVAYGDTRGKLEKLARMLSMRAVVI